MRGMVLAFMLLIVPVASVSAYVDPGTGSMIVQAVIAAVVGGGAVLAAFWRKLFRRRRQRDEEAADEDGEQRDA